MNTMSASPSDATAKQVAPRVLVWDAPVRVFHWLMVLCFAGAWLTAESERQRLLHVTFGYGMVVLVAFRILWGFIGSRYARFSEFVRGPRAIVGYVAGLLRRAPEHFRGHNPAGAIAILALLALAIVVPAAGLATYNDFGGHWVEEAHEIGANLMLLVIAGHVAGVLLSSVLHRENLIGAMFSGRKPGNSSDAIPSARLGVAMLLIAAMLALWTWQFLPSRGMTAASDSEVAAQAADADAD
ncbi:MAG: cytochrome b/b6 domain-containing protein [Rhodanobacteraceae bacterium]|jgi:cytochrome b|nr:cytochrome b/b6 domain-containing protein [Rhodanobacteraceae bacterium]MBL0040484.1 cytochrome b/b6 domain-containing protein [Xanthomonadales bacterium]MBP6079146.1 cytochrome b/b6 domain-containing protein [Xanthomonadales bacterium]MBP7623878.1 cytochrome b/b6 domain-containing protein [Xanthomonadales bacterium]